MRVARRAADDFAVVVGHHELSAIVNVATEDGAILMIRVFEPLSGGRRAHVHKCATGDGCERPSLGNIIERQLC